MNEFDAAQICEPLRSGIPSHVSELDEYPELKRKLSYVIDNFQDHMIKIYLIGAIDSLADSDSRKASNYLNELLREIERGK